MVLIQSFEYGKLKVEIYYNGRNTLPNKVYIDGLLILEDDTFKPNPTYNIDDTQTMVSLLGFYTLRIGDVDKEYFDRLDCPKLLEWSENDEETRLMLSDFESKENTTFLEENKLDFEHCNRIEQFITKH